ncbi:unnamed protein product [Phytophthora fragariaefolia]|uniref:Microsomal glutathione S-transferase 1 n=1 Tax=Phytophthora fragariaefolia TaxID=1490495 RepID=A0A9W7D4W4_9STRA|nr:unnamed protein product [Phytophthora fragariaefolia]
MNRSNEPSQSFGAHLWLRTVPEVLAGHVHPRSQGLQIGESSTQDIQLPKAEGRKQDYGLTETKDKEVAKAREEDHRWQRIIANDLESIPFALFVFGGDILADSNGVVHASALIVYTASRCLHTYMYANAIQPHRSNCWFVGVAATLVGMFNAIVAIM